MPWRYKQKLLQRDPVIRLGVFKISQTKCPGGTNNSYKGIQVYVLGFFKISQKKCPGGTNNSYKGIQVYAVGFLK